METSLLRREKQVGNAWSFWFSRPDGFVFQGGDYTELALDKAGERRWFSIAAGPQEKDLQFCIKIADQHSTFKQGLLDLKPTQTAHLSPPMGNFNVPNQPDKLLFIAGGIGITPFRSILLEEAHRHIGHDIVLFYTARSAQHLFLNEISTDIKLIKHISGSKRLTLPDILAAVPDASERMIYLAGPEPMMEQYHEQLLTQAHPRWRLRLSYFTGYNEL